MSKPEKLPFIVDKGKLMPADGYTVTRLRERGYKMGDKLMAVLTKPRNPKFNGLAHNMGRMVQQNIEGFENLTPHQCLKRLQIESGVACDLISALIPDMGMVPFRVPRSFSYESMDEGEYSEAIKGISRYIVTQYWPSLTPEEVERMAETMPND